MGHCRRLYGCMQPSGVNQQTTQEPYPQGYVHPVPELNGKHWNSSARYNLPCVSWSACFIAVDRVVRADPEWSLNAIPHQESKPTRKITSVQKKGAMASPARVKRLREYGVQLEKVWRVLLSMSASGGGNHKAVLFLAVTGVSARQLLSLLRAKADCEAVF